MMAKHLRLCLCLWLVTFIPRQSVAQVVSYSYGMVTGSMGDPVGPKMMQLGAGWVRAGCNWNEMQPSSRDDFRFGCAHSVVDTAAQLGLGVYFTILGTPGWANGGQGGNVMPTDINDWYNFVHRFAQEFNGSNIIIGVWNEPNLSQFLIDDGQAHNYVQLFNTAAAARNDAAPNLRLGGPETSDSALSSGYLFWAVVGIGASMLPSDIFAVHWYPGASMDLSSYMRQMHLYVGSALKVWLTEVGYNICSDQDQAAAYDFLVATYLNEGRTYWTNIFPYVLYRDVPDCGAIVRTDGTNRPAFDRYQTWISLFP